MMQGRVEYMLFGVPTPGFYRAEERKRRIEAAERVRTLYVAMTRARDRLVIAGNWNMDSRPKSVDEARNHLELLEHRASGGGTASDLRTRALALAERNRSRRRHQGNEEDVPVGVGHVESTDVRWIFPGLPNDIQSEALAGSDRETLPSADTLTREANQLRERRAVAARRSVLPFSITASRLAQQMLRGDDDADGREPLLRSKNGAEIDRAGNAARLDPGVVTAVGSAIHRILESFDLQRDAGEELRRQVTRLPMYLATLIDDDSLQPALRESQRMLEGLAASKMFERFLTLRPRILGREVDFLHLPEDYRDKNERVREPEAVGFISGTIDLLYEDLRGDVVVADYKTDRVSDDGGLRRLIDAYARQGKVYVDGVREALSLACTPRLELWFVTLDRIESIDFDRL